MEVLLLARLLSGLAGSPSNVAAVLQIVVPARTGGHPFIGFLLFAVLLILLFSLLTPPASPLLGRSR